MPSILQNFHNLNAPSNPTGSGSAGLFSSLVETTVKPVSRQQFNSVGAPASVSMLNVFDWFDLLPAAAVAAATDKYVTLLGTNTPLATQSATGGLQLATGATTTNQAGIAGVAATGFSAPVTATNGLVFRSRVSLASLVTNIASIGLNSTVTSVNPILNAADGAAFLADPANSLTASTGATAAQALNWILVTSIAGVVSYTFTTFPIFAAQDVNLAIVLNPGLTWSFFINELPAGTPAGVATANATVLVIGGVKTTANTVATMSIRFAQLERVIG